MNYCIVNYIEMLFYEPQEGDLCRKHAINSYFGYSKITTADFEKYIKEYDEYVRKTYNIKSDAKNFDLINANQITLVSFIMRKFGIYFKYIPINAFYRKYSISSLPLTVDFIFVYNLGHIWSVKKYNDIWYKVDSLYGVSRYDVNMLTETKDIGLLLPIDHIAEYNLNINRITYELKRNSVTDEKSMTNYLIFLHQNKLLLHNLEVPLSICVDILDFKRNAKFKVIVSFVDDYLAFSRELYTNGNIANITFITKNLPSLIFRLIRLGRPYKKI